MIHLALLLLFLFAARGLGAIALQAVGFRDRSRPEFYVYSIALGLGVIGHLTLLMGSLRLLYREAAFALLSVSLLISLVELMDNRAAYRQAIARLRLPEKVHWFPVVLVLLLFVNWLYPLFANALVPAYNWDAVAYHLAIPKIYIQNHAITYISFIPYSNWPLETELLFAFGLLLSSEPLAQLITWTALLLTCAALYWFGRQNFSGEVGLLAAVLFASTPMVTTLAGTGLIELPLTLYTLLATLTFLKWVQSGEKYSWILSAIFGGLAASTKLNGALVPLFLGLFVALVTAFGRPASLAKAVKRFALYGLVAFAVVAPWYAKTWVQTGSPFWPFLYPLLGGNNWDVLGSEYLFGFIRLPNMPLTPVNWLAGLWKLTVDSVNFGPSRVTLGWLYLALLPLAIPAVIFSKPGQRQIIRWLAVLGVVYYTSWFFQTHQTRFLMPATSVLALLAAIGVMWLWSLFQERWAGWIKVGLVVALFALSWLAAPADRALLTSHWPYLSGQMTRRQFLTSKVPGYETYAYANKNLPGEAYVWLALYESRGYYLDRNYMWANPISQRALHLENFQDAGQLAQELRARGFTHILFLSTHLDDYTYIRYGKKITGLTRSLLADHARLIHQSHPLALYELQAASQ